MRDQAHQTLQRTILNFGQHPNLAGVVYVGLGCEQLDLSTAIREQLIPIKDLTRQGAVALPIPDRYDGPLKLSIQSGGGTESTASTIVEYLTRILPRANDVRRVTVPTSRLILGLNCGGSDSFSGISANPALGFTSDLLGLLGGTSVLGETPETYGAEI